MRFPKRLLNHHCLLLMIEKWKKAVDNKKVFGALLADLSKTFDSMSNDLLTAKLHAYRLSFPALQLMQKSPKSQTKNSSWDRL